MKKMGTEMKEMAAMKLGEGSIGVIGDNVQANRTRFLSGVGAGVGAGGRGMHEIQISGGHN